jgi:hypothetical protein
MRRPGVRLGTFMSLQEAADEIHHVIREARVTALAPVRASAVRDSCAHRCTGRVQNRSR